MYFGKLPQKLDIHKKVQTVPTKKCPTLPFQKLPRVGHIKKVQTIPTFLKTKTGHAFFKKWTFLDFLAQVA